MNARYYEPATGRFTSQDSFRGEGEAFWHLYLYCDSDPVNFTDPTGHAKKTSNKNGNRVIVARKTKNQLVKMRGNDWGAIAHVNAKMEILVRIRLVNYKRKIEMCMASITVSKMFVNDPIAERTTVKDLKVQSIKVGNKTRSGKALRKDPIITGNKRGFVMEWRMAYFTGFYQTRRSTATAKFRINFSKGLKTSTGVPAYLSITMGY